MTCTYTAFGLNIQSDFPLPELLPVAGNGPQEWVWIRAGQVPPALEKPEAGGVLYQAAAGQFLLNMEGIARYLVREGREIIVQPAPNGDLAEMRLFLFGSALAALLHQRGALTLHSSGMAFEHAGVPQAVLFSGHSGAGKSTLAAAFHQRGYPLIADDQCAIRLQAGRPTAYPAFPQVKLWQDVTEKLSVPRQALNPLRADLEKFALPLADGFHAAPLPVYAIYLLQANNQADITLLPLQGMSKFHLLLNHTFRQRFLDGLGMRPAHFQLASAVAAHVRVVRVLRPSYPFRLDELVAEILKDLQEGADGPAPAAN